MKEFGFFLILPIIYAGTGAGQAVSFEKPSVGIVTSKTNFEHRWGVTQMAGHGWAGVVNLAGLPYSTLFIEDVAKAENLDKYSVLVFAQCIFIKEEQHKPQRKN